MLKCKLGETGILPFKKNYGDAGFDLASPTSFVIPPFSTYKLNFDIKVEIPRGEMGLLVPRSSTGSRGIRLKNTIGIIDSGYRGDIIGVLENTTDSAISVEYGERLLQLILLPVALQGVTSVAELNMEDDRMGGFGSTGK